MSGQPALATRAGASACQARPRQWTVPLVLLLDEAAPGAVVLQEATDDGQLLARVTVQARDLPAAVAEREAARLRWVWDDTSRRYPALLAAGVRVERCHDPVSYTHLRAHETDSYLVCRLLLEKKK